MPTLSFAGSNDKGVGQPRRVELSGIPHLRSEMWGTHFRGGLGLGQPPILLAR